MADGVVIDAQVHGGEPVLRRTRGTVDAVVRALAAGDDGIRAREDVGKRLAGAAKYATAETRPRREHPR